MSWLYFNFPTNSRCLVGPKPTFVSELNFISSSEIISRTVTEMRVTVPPAWTPATLYWNGLSLQDLKTPGCYALTVEKELLHAALCEN